jgi:hypothetical protein
MTIVFDTTFTKVIENVSFGNLSSETLCDMFKNGSLFSHFAERFIAENYGLKHVKGCKSYDFEDPADSNIKIDEKTFTGYGCKFMPSNMIGQGRTFDKAVFDEKSKNMVYVIVSNINFPEIKIRFVKGYELSVRYPNGVIPFKDHDKFFSNTVF